MPICALGFYSKSKDSREADFPAGETHKDANSQFYRSNRPLAPQGSTNPLEDTGRPISSARIVP